MVESYLAVRIGEQGNFDSISLETVQTPVLQAGEVFVRMEFSTMNPSDFLAASGNYQPMPPSYFMGFEGCGTVVATGSDPIAVSLLNKRVGLVTLGTWGQYTVANYNSVFPLIDSARFEDSANLIVNPMTVALFIEKIQNNNHRAAIQNAAASALGKMLIKWCKKIEVPLINLVRKSDQVELLKAFGAEHVFSTSEEGWKAKVKSLCDELKVTVAFDAIGGAGTKDLVDLINDTGVVYNYGLLSGEDCRVSPVSLIFQRKTLDGLWLSPWLFAKSYEDRMKLGVFVQENIEEIFKTEHSGNIVELRDVVELIRKFKDTPATNNKLLVRNN